VRSGGASTRSPRRADRDGPLATARVRPCSSPRHAPRVSAWWAPGLSGPAVPTDAARLGASRRVGPAGSRGPRGAALWSAWSPVLAHGPRRSRPPGWPDPQRVLTLAGRRVVEAGWPSRPVRWPLWRDPRGLVPLAPMQPWGEAKGQQGAGPPGHGGLGRGLGGVGRVWGRRGALGRPLLSARRRRGAGSGPRGQPGVAQAAPHGLDRPRLDPAGEHDGGRRPRACAPGGGCGRRMAAPRCWGREPARGSGARPSRRRARHSGGTGTARRGAPRVPAAQRHAAPGAPPPGVAPVTAAAGAQGPGRRVV
jgi:hypothetical protein